jgi:hypothetical protein
MTLDRSLGHIEIRLGRMDRRMATVTATRTSRLIVIDDCVASIGREISKGLFEICAYEWKPGEALWPEDAEKIGALNTKGYLSVNLPPDAFRQLWAIGDGSKTSACTLIMKVKLEPSEAVLSVPEVTLVEPLP